MMSTVDKDADAATETPRSLSRVLDLLETVVTSGARTLSEAAADTGLTPTTARRYLVALQGRGYVVRTDDQVYRPGPTLGRLAAVLVDRSPLGGLVASAQPILDQLAAETGESAYLAVADGWVGTYVVAAQSDRSIRHVGYAGQTVPLAGGALGAAVADVGTIAIATGAVEPDITALSLAIPPVDGMGVAISVIGPHHRFDDIAVARHRIALRTAVDRLQQLREGA